MGRALALHAFNPILFPVPYDSLSPPGVIPDMAQDTKIKLRNSSSYQVQVARPKSFQSTKFS